MARTCWFEHELISALFILQQIPAMHFLSPLLMCSNLIQNILLVKTTQTQNSSNSSKIFWAAGQYAFQSHTLESIWQHYRSSKPVLTAINCLKINAKKPKQNQTKLKPTNKQTKKKEKIKQNLKTTQNKNKQTKKMASPPRLFTQRQLEKVIYTLQDQVRNGDTA